MNAAVFHHLRLGFLTFLTAVFLWGCGPKAAINPSLESGGSSMYALLPVNTASKVEPAELAVVQGAIRTELEAKGYALLDEGIVNSVCVDSACENRQQFFDTYSVDGLIIGQVNSAAQSNLGLATYSNITGTLRIVDREGTELASIEHSESERGGIVFESGQVIEGLKSQFIEEGEEVFRKLAVEYARAIAAELPRIENGDTDTADMSIQTTDYRMLAPNTFRVCLEGTPGNRAFLKVGRRQTNLREVSDGRYCGAYSFIHEGDELQLELRSPFGSVVRADLTLPIEPRCDVKDLVQVMRDEAGANRVSLSCSMDGSEADEGLQMSCMEFAKRCDDARLVVYKSRTQVGPFIPLRKASQQLQWIDSTPDEKVRYHVVAISKSGASSLPIEITPAGGE